MKQYSPRVNKSFSNYRVTAIKFLREYNTYEKGFVGSLADEVKELQKSKAVELIKKKFSEGETELNTDELINNAGEYMDLITKSSQLTDEIKLCKECFLMDNDFEKLKLLCSIYYEDCLELEYDTYDELYSFAMETFEGFFLNNQNILNIGNSTKQNLITKSPTPIAES